MTFEMTDAAWRAQRLRFSLGEIAELRARIKGAAASDLWRAAARVAAAHRLRCFSDVVHADLAQHIEARRQQLGLASATAPYPPAPARAA